MAFELILQLVSPFDALEPSLETVRVAGIRVFRGTAPLGAYQRAMPGLPPKQGNLHPQCELPDDGQADEGSGSREEGGGVPCLHEKTGRGG